MEKTGVREISRRTGYSPATVSNVLNHKPGVSRKAIDAVLGAARELGLEPEDALTRITLAIARRGIQAIDQDDFYPVVVEGMRSQASQQGLDVDFATIDLGSHEVAARQVEELFSNPASAAIIHAPEMSERDFRLLDAYADRLVLTEGWSDAAAFDAVATDSEASAYQAVRYLLERGHRRIGYLAGEPRLHAYHLRGRGYRRALVDAGIDCTDLPVVHMRARTEEARVDMLGWLSTDPVMPTAFLADSDRIAVGAIRALSERGFSVPQDVSVMGFEGLLSANFCTPPLTTVFVPKAEIGRFAVRKLTDALGGKREFFSTTLVAASIAERGSVRSL